MDTNSIASGRTGRSIPRPMLDASEVAMSVLGRRTVAPGPRHGDMEMCLRRVVGASSREVRLWQPGAAQGQRRGLDAGLVGPDQPSTFPCHLLWDF